MKPQAIAFLFGILLLINFNYLPDKRLLIAIIPLILFLKLINPSNKLKYLIALLMGFAWSMGCSYNRIEHQLPSTLEDNTLTISGEIISLPAYTQQQCTFYFAVNSIPNWLGGKVKLNWLNPPKNLQAGDQWQLSVKLKRIHGTMNPGGFDYEGFALQENIAASGSVLTQANHHLLSSHWYHRPLDRFRQCLQRKIHAAFLKHDYSPWIEALTIGERQHIPQTNWEVLRNTGTNHLMAIAGLHIGYLSALVHRFVFIGWSRLKYAPLWLPTQQAAAVGALVIAIFYSALAGFSIPTQRACIMLSLFLFAILQRRKVIAWQPWSLALWTILWINPLSILTESFWLSFGSVALIIYGMSGRRLVTNAWWQWGRMQWVIAIGLIPFSFWLFHQCSLIGFIANSIAIPWIGFLIVPLCFFGCISLFISTALGGFILTIANNLLNILWQLLTYFSTCHWAVWHQTMPSILVLIISCIGVVLLLLPAGAPGRWLGIIWMLPLFLYSPPAPQKGDAWLTLLDVGQGLATVVQTQHHLLIFDTGLHLGEMDMGENVITPFLHTIAAKKIDKLIISHGDNDHIGGSAALLKNFPVLTINTSVPEKLLPFKAEYCFKGENFIWDNVLFKFLYPTPDDLGLNNNSSCVLRISTQDQHILLVGDIEKLAEARLVATIGQGLYSQIMIAPHHGSQTSSTDAFIQAVQPQYILYPVGYRNRYHFPHVGTIEKYTRRGVKQFDSVTHGAIQIQLLKHTVITYRQLMHHFWNS